MKSSLSIRFISLLLIFLSSSLIAATAGNSSSLRNIELLGSDGKQHQLNDFIGKGKWTTIVVWGPKCPACIEEMPSIQGLYDDKESTDINVLGLAVDFPTFSYASLKQVQQFEEDYFISFPNLLISSKIFYELGLGPLQGTPTIILVDPEGKVSAKQLGGVPRDIIEKYIAKQKARSKLLDQRTIKHSKNESL